MARYRSSYFGHMWRPSPLKKYIRLAKVEGKGRRWWIDGFDYISDMCSAGRSERPGVEDRLSRRKSFHVVIRNKHWLDMALISPSKVTLDVACGLIPQLRTCAINRGDAQSWPATFFVLIPFGRVLLHLIAARQVKSGQAILFPQYSIPKQQRCGRKLLFSALSVNTAVKRRRRREWKTKEWQPCKYLITPTLLSSWLACFRFFFLLLSCTFDVLINPPHLNWM